MEGKIYNPMHFSKKEGEAYEEADMMKAMMGENPVSGRIHNHRLDAEGRAPTEEDYNTAFEIIEELKKAAEKEPTFEKFQTNFLRIFTIFPLIPLEIFRIIDNALFSEGSEVSEDVANMKKRMFEALEDAASKLRKMEEKGKEYRKGESNFLG
jgi:hypothetical protein